MRAHVRCQNVCTYLCMSTVRVFFNRAFVVSTTFGSRKVDGNKMGKCYVNNDWFRRTDPNGRIVGEYATKENKHAVFCKVCETSICCNKGFQAIAQHTQKCKHKENAKMKLDPMQLHLAAKNTAAIDQEQQHAGPRLVNIYSEKDEAIKAELIWTMNVVAHNNSSSSCNNITNVLGAMVKNIPTTFTLGRTKVTYYMTDALGPYFRKELLDDIQKENAVYSIEFDESTSEGGMKEYQVSIRYWSSKENATASNFLETFFVGHATGEVLHERILQAITNANLPLARMLMLGSDGPTVNQKVFRLVNADVISAPGRNDKKSLLSIGTCNLHIIHNAFEKGLNKLGKKAEDLSINLFYYFDGYSSRKEDYQKSQAAIKVPMRAFMKHVPSRWLTLGPVSERVNEQYPAIKHFFLETVAKKASVKQLRENNRLAKIVEDLKNPSTIAEILFVSETAQLFERFCKIFQKQEPLIHILYEEAKNLLMVIVNKICKPETVKNFWKINDPFAAEHMRPVKDVLCGERTEAALQKLSDRDVQQFRYNAQQHYKAAAEHMLAKSILRSVTAKHFRFLQPQLLTDSISTGSIAAINRILPLGISEAQLLDEWLLLQLEKIPTASAGQRIDHYWRKIFDIKNGMGDPKFPLITKIVKASLSLVHGSADVERRFSDSGNQLTEDRASMSIRTLNARMIIKDGLRRYDGKPDRVFVTKELIAMGRSAHSNYKAYLEKEKQKEIVETTKAKQKKDEEKMKQQLLEDQEKNRKDITKLEDQLMKAKQANDSSVEAREKLLEEAVNRLQTALKGNDIQGAKVAHGLFKGVQAMKSDLNTSEIEPLRRIIEKRNSSLITSFFKKARFELEQTGQEEDVDGLDAE